MRSRILPLFIIFAIIFGNVRASWAQQGGLSLIRDAEIEDTIRHYAAPVFEAAGLDAGAVSVHLVNNNQLNAFVAGGQRIFVFTGLLLRVETPNQLIGVLAHETGHISGGHLARTQDALRSATTASIITFILGAAALAAGGGQAAGAIIASGGAVGQRQFLKYSRTQEGAADQAAMTYLEATGQSGRGLAEFLDVLGDQEALVTSRQDPYARSHPISRERIAALSDRIRNSPYRDQPDTAENIMRLKRMQAKLYGFLKSKSRTLRKYPVSNQSLPARYARAIAYYRVPELDAALPEIDKLIAESPNDPYFRELKGQVLFENGRIAESVPPNEAAVKLKPQSPLLRFGLARAQIATGDPALNRAAIRHLEEVVRLDDEMPGAWAQLAIAYGRDGQLGLSALSSAEQFFLTGKKKDARQQAARAQKRLPEGSPGWLRAVDIENAAKKDKDK